uniref:Oogenesin 3 like 2 n=1 Tax=Rattus norvegicus TaxID=10116 RepID=D3ZJ16_RAT
MSDQALPTLEHLAIQGLASNERLAISVVEDLPKVFFPPLFKEAFIKRRKKLVKHMVTTWPYPYLYIGPLLYDFDVDTFKAVLEGVDRLNCQKVRSRRCKLKELNLLDVQRDFLDIWTPTRDVLRVPEAQIEEDPKTVLRQPLRVHADYGFLLGVLDQYHAHFMKWVRQRLHKMRFSFYKLVPKRRKLRQEKLLDPLGY